MARLMLIGSDGSSHAEDAVALGALLGPLLGAEPALLHAHPYGQLEGLLSDGERERLIGDAVAAAERHATTHLGPRAPAIRVVSDRSPARALLAAATAEDVAAIVVGSSQRGPVGRVLAGGVAERLLAGAPCPVVVAPAGFTARTPLGIGVVGAGFDGSPDADAALRVAAALARANAGPLRVIAVHRPVAFGSLPIALDRASITVNQQLHAVLAEQVEQAVAELAAGGEVTARLVEGAPAAVLAEESERLGLLVVGSRGYGPAGQILLGSVAARVMRNAACPVMVVPRSAAERTPATPR